MILIAIDNFGGIDMDGIKSAVMAVCAVSAARCVIGSIVSASKLKNQVVSILDLLLAFVMIAPFAQGFVNFTMPDISDFELIEAEYPGDPYSEALKAETEANISAVLGQQLTAAGINYVSIVTDVNISADYSISISSVTVTAEDYESAALIIKSCLGVETEVIKGAV